MRSCDLYARDANIEQYLAAEQILFFIATTKLYKRNITNITLFT